jgi:hypothetical protein
MELYTAGEAREKLGNIATSTFHRIVNAGRIRKITPPNKKQGMYVKEDVDNLAIEMGATRRGERKAPAETLPIEVDWMRPQDLPSLLSLDSESFQEELIGSIPLYYSWWKKNNYTCLMAFEAGNRKEVLAQITLIPLPLDVIFAILRGKREETSITADEIEEYIEGREYEVFCENAITQSAHPEYLGPVLRHLTEFWCQQWPGIKINRVFTRAATPAGLYLIQKLYFGPLYELGDNAFVLDLRYKSPSRYIRAYQRCTEEKEVRLLQQKEGGAN